MPEGTFGTPRPLLDYDCWFRVKMLGYPDEDEFRDIVNQSIKERYDVVSMSGTTEMETHDVVWADVREDRMNAYSLFSVAALASSTSPSRADEDNMVVEVSSELDNVLPRPLVEDMTTDERLVVELQLPHETSEGLVMDLMDRATERFSFISGWRLDSDVPGAVSDVVLTLNSDAVIVSHLMRFDEYINDEIDVINMVLSCTVTEV